MKRLILLIVLAVLIVMLVGSSASAVPDGDTSAVYGSMANNGCPPIKLK